MFRSWLPAVWCGFVLTSKSLIGAAADQWDAQADSIVNAFTVDDIIGQMTQINIDNLLKTDGTLDENKVRDYAKLRVGSYLNSPFAGGAKNGKYGWTAKEWRDVMTRIQAVSMANNGGHPIVFGIDSVHGANYISNAVLFGQQINGAASFNPDLVYEMGRVTGRDTQAAGIPWVFGPILELAQNPLWSRTYETFGEDPYLVSVMADSIIRGLQSNSAIAACMKHFVAYSKTPQGHDRDGVSISDFDLLNYFVQPFIAAVNAGVMSTMENYIAVNGVPTVSSSKLLRDLLRSDMGFQGVAVTDWAEINNLVDWHRVAPTQADAVAMALKQTSIDMSMVPYDTQFIDHTKAMLAANPDQLPRLKESARRVVKMKLKLGLYTTPVPGADNVNLVGSAADVASALELARESIVLLKNQNNVLPLAASSSVFLTGHSANDVGYLCGGWSLRWQGYSGNDMFPHGVTVKQGFEKIAGSAVTYFNGLSADGSYTAADLATAKSQAAKSAFTVVVMGEGSYTEKPGDIDDLALPAGQIAYVRELASTGTKVIIVLVGGRPRLLNGLTDSAHAVINAMLPGELGGQAIAEIIYGRVNPSGRLPITYPKDPANIMIPYNHRTNTQCANGYCQMQWEFGTGLSYTTFTYSALSLSKTSVSGSSDSLTATITVTNSGALAGKETVMLFLTQPFRKISVPEVKMLKKFKKVALNAGASTTVTFTLKAADWSVYDPQIGNGFSQVAEAGDFVVAIKPETDCNVYGTTNNPLCARFRVTAPSFSANAKTEL
uniref:beta-glucosidase n=1 Tax=Globisporangium ultimum (strain ATCC 200006 / CBS 805.95 / DAOM BR144) TaxID=431595 RepID=K3WVG8_GLOUD